MKFRALPASRDLHHSLLKSGAKQVVFEHENSGQRLTCWPVDDEFLVMELSDTGPLTEAPDLKFAHDLMAEAHVHVLGMLDGYAEPVSPRDFDALEKSRTPKDRRGEVDAGLGEATLKQFLEKERDLSMDDAEPAMARPAATGRLCGSDAHDRRANAYCARCSPAAQKLCSFVRSWLVRRRLAVRWFSTVLDTVAQCLT